MKTMSCIIALTCCIQVAAQSGNGFFDEMDEQERNEYLVEKAKELYREAAAAGNEEAARILEEW